MRRTKTLIKTSESRPEKSLNAFVVQKVVEFYRSDEVNWIMPDKKQTSKRKTISFYSVSRNRTKKSTINDLNLKQIKNTR